MDRKKIKLRKCIVCGEQKHKNELIRVVKNKEDEISVDYTGKQNGRGAYICKNKECINKAIDKNLLNRHLKINIPTEIVQELLDM